jgi:hypothetical protein
MNCRELAWHYLEAEVILHHIISGHLKYLCKDRTLAVLHSTFSDLNIENWHHIIMDWLNKSGIYFDVILTKLQSYARVRELW